MAEKLFLLIIPIVLGVSMFLFGFVILFTKISLRLARLLVNCFAIIVLAAILTKTLSYAITITMSKGIAIYSVAILICLWLIIKETKKHKEEK